MRGSKKKDCTKGGWVVAALWTVVVKRLSAVLVLGSIFYLTKKQDLTY
jgi:hypothetical protein